jgi:hypothetical protein
VSREIFGLVEAPLCPAPWMQRHWDYAIGTLQYLSARLEHHGGQWRRQLTPSLVLECVEDRAQRPIVVAGGARSVK